MQTGVVSWICQQWDISNAAFRWFLCSSVIDHLTVAEGGGGGGGGGEKIGLRDWRFWCALTWLRKNKSKPLTLPVQTLLKAAERKRRQLSSLNLPLSSFMCKRLSFLNWCHSACMKFATVNLYPVFLREFLLTGRDETFFGLSGAEVHALDISSSTARRLIPSCDCKAWIEVYLFPQD